MTDATTNRIREVVTDACSALAERLTVALSAIANDLASDVLRERLAGLLEKPLTAGFTPTTAPPSSGPTGRKQNSCRKCGTVGFTAKTCGKTHNVSTSPAATSGGPGMTRADRATPPATSLPHAPPPHQLRSSCRDHRGRRAPRCGPARASRTSGFLRSTARRTSARSSSLSPR